MQIHWPLVVSTVCQRVGLGFFICVYLTQLLMGSPVPLGTTALVTLGFLIVGGLASMLHLQRPQRIMNAFSNMKSHLTQEALITPFLGVALLACGLNGLLYDMGAAILALGGVTAILAAAFLVCTGLAYQMGSRPAWNTPFVLVLFLLTAAESGAIGVVMLWLMSIGMVPNVLAGAALLLTLACVICQAAYVIRMRSVGYGVNVDATQEPYRGAFYTWVLLGAALPVCALLLMFAMPALAATLALLAWLCSAGGIAAWTVLFFRGARKVKMFPMYPVDLNLDM